MTILSDGQLTLRAPVTADAAVVARAVQASLGELEPWMPWATADYDEAAASWWIQHGDAHPFLILDADGDVVGTCGLNSLDEPNKRANLGYWVSSQHTGRGVATAATILVAGYGLTELGLRRIEIVMSVENEASRRVAERAGATYEGVLRNRLFLRGDSHDAHGFSVTTVDQLR